MRGCQAALLIALISPVPAVVAENGPVAKAVDQSAGAKAIGSSDAPTRLLPRWTAPRRAPLLGQAVADELAHAEGPGAAQGETGSAEEPVKQPSMIDVVGAGLFISPITDENYKPAESETPSAKPPLTQQLPDAVRQAMKAEDWTTAARIVVHSPDTEDRLPSKLNQLLIAAGASSVENHEVELTVKRDHIRFYHPSDHMHAIEVAAALDGVLDTLLVKDFSFLRPQPPKGLVEIWLR